MATRKISTRKNGEKGSSSIEHSFEIPANAAQAVKQGRVASEADWNALAMQQWVVSFQTWVRNFWKANKRAPTQKEADAYKYGAKNAVVVEIQVVTIPATLMKLTDKQVELLRKDILAENPDAKIVVK